jgi:hypothetical protein
MKQLLFSVGQFIVKNFKRDERCEILEHINIKNVDGDEQRFKRLKKALLLLPDNVLYQLIANNITILYSKNSKPVQNGKWAGYYAPSDQLIYIWDNGSGSLYWQITTIIHEVGHFIDFTVGRNRFNSCIDTDFHEISLGENKYYNKFAEQVRNYYTNNIREYFAQSFAEYFLVPGFKEKCPETTRYIEEVLKEIAI